MSGPQRYAVRPKAHTETSPYPGKRTIYPLERSGTQIEVKAPKYSDIASVVGAAGTLEDPMRWDQLREIAREDQFDAKHDV